MTRFSCLAFVFLSVSACQLQQTITLSPEEKKVMQAEIRKTLERYHRDIREEGLLAELKYLDASEDFFWVPPGYTSAISYDSVAAFLKGQSGHFRKIENAFDTLRILPQSREIASYTGRLISTMTDTTGEISTFTLWETGLLIKRTDGWKLLSGQTALLQD